MNTFKWIGILSTVLLALSTATIATAVTDERTQVAHFFNLKSTRDFTLLPIHAYQQTETYTCGPATIMSLMHYYGMLDDKDMNKNTELRIAKEMGTTEEKSTSFQQMVIWLEQHGFTVTSGKNGTLKLLQDNLKKGVPTIVEWIDWGGHWEVVTGYNAVGKTFDDDRDTLFFANPAAHFEDANVQYINGITAFNADRFASMWFDAQYFKPGHLVKGVYIIAVPKKTTPN